MAPTLSLVVTTYEWPAALAVVLDGVRRQRVAPLEVIVADDGSGPATHELLVRAARDFPVPLRHVWGPDEGFRLNTSRNRGIAAARGEYVVLLDGDMVPHRAFVADHLAAARPGGYVQGGRVLLGPDTTARALAAGSLAVHWWSRDLRNRANALRLPALAPLYRGPQGATRRTRGAHLAFWRDDAVRVNGFDEAFTTWGRDDNEFVARLLHAGVVRRNLKWAAVAYHLHHRVGGTVAAENEARLGRTLAERRVRAEHGLDAQLPRVADFERVLAG
jgi:glycosyltransferase involved in cell wall biosynthesis